MKVEAHLLAEDAMALSVGETVRCALADGFAFTATVSYVSPLASKAFSAIGIEESRTAVELKPSALPTGVGAGHPVELAFASPIASQVLTAPLSAVIPLEGGREGVYVLLDGQAVLREVVTGRRSGGRVELSAGVSAGDALILNPAAAGVRDGAKAAAE